MGTGWKRDAKRCCESEMVGREEGRGRRCGVCEARVGRVQGGRAWWVLGERGAPAAAALAGVAVRLGRAGGHE